MERRLAAVLAADISGYSALMEAHEEETHRVVATDITRVMEEAERFQGRVFTFAGDGFLAEFPSAVLALRCAIRIQSGSARRGSRNAELRNISYRIGIHTGEIMVVGDRTGGNAVNIAARLEQVAEPGGIRISRAVYDQVKGIVPAEYVPLGEHRLKNIRDLIALFRVATDRAPNGGTGARLPEGVGVAADYRPSLAVLPFRTASESQEDTYFAEGMVEDIIRLLGGMRDIVVVSRTSTLGFTGPMPDLRRVEQELNVQDVLHGSVRRSAQQIRISVELDDAISRESLWADRFDGALADVFEMQDEIALRAAGAIAPHLRERQARRALRKDRNSVNAYDLTLQALARLYPPDRESLAAAEALLRQAVLLDSNYSGALSHLAYLHLFRIGQGLSADEHADRLAAAKAASLAIDRDGSDALALAIHGHMRGYLGKEHEEALTIIDRALSMAPSCALAWTYSSFTSGILGDAQGAITRARTALRLAPIGPEAGCWHEHAYSQANYLAGNMEEAVAWGQTAARHGRQSSNLRCLAAALVAAGRFDEAKEVGRRLLQIIPNFGLKAFRAYTPLRGEVADLFVERLRLAGLPE